MIISTIKEEMIINCVSADVFNRNRLGLPDYRFY